MEKLSNEKIMAIDEFSNTVLDKIYKNHEEAVFLYDMLNNKHIQLKNSMTEMEKIIKNGKKEFGSELTLRENNILEENPEKEEVIKSKLLLDEISVGVGTKLEISREVTEDYALQEDDEEKDINQEEKAGEDKNKILEYHKMGKSEIEIAKILDIGVGEVKLIIGLYKGNNA